MNESIRAMAEAIEDADVHFAANYPGFHSNELQTALNMPITSVNEKTAYAYAWGCSLAGKRAVVSFKNVGLNDAADAFLGSLFLGCNAGLVYILFDDCDIQHSQNRIDVRPYFDIYGGLWFEPRSIPELYTLTKEAFSLSERFRLPVVVRVTNILYNNGMTASAWERSSSLVPTREPIVRQTDRSPFVAHPSQAHWQESELQRKRYEIDDYIDQLYSSWDSLESAPTDIVCGAKRFVKAVDALRIFTLPIPAKRLKSLYSASPDKPITVHEHGARPYYRERIAAHLSDRNIQSNLMPPHAGIRFVYHNRNCMELLFSRLRNRDKTFVFGDLGGYTMDPGRTIEACLCFGTACASAMGFAQARPDYDTAVVVGDAAYLHSGQVCLYEMAMRKVNVNIFVLENGGAQGTGGQLIPGDLRAAPPSVKVQEFDYETMLPVEMDRLLDSISKTGVNIIILHTRNQEQQYEQQEQRQHTS